MSATAQAQKMMEQMGQMAQPGQDGSQPQIPQSPGAPGGGPPPQQMSIEEGGPDNQLMTEGTNQEEQIFST